MIERQIIKGKKVNFDQLLSYGFKEKKNQYEYEKSIFNEHFLICISITKDGLLTGKIWDNHVNDEYTAFRIKNQNGEFAGRIREEYQHILQDIVDHCYNSNYFLYDQTNRIANKIIEQVATAKRETPIPPNKTFLFLVLVVFLVVSSMTLLSSTLKRLRISLEEVFISYSLVLLNFSIMFLSSIFLITLSLFLTF